MNKYIPDEVKDLSESQQRVMQNVLNEIENNSKRPKRQWRYVVISTVLVICALFFTLNEVNIKDEPQNATELHLDLTKPIFSEEQGLLYLHGVTLGDSQSKVREHLGEDYSIVKEDGNRADTIFDYDGNARFYFYEDKLDGIVFMNLDINYFDKLFNDYEGVKVISSTDNDRFIYSKETSHLLKATFVPDGNLYLYLLYPGPDFLENPDFRNLEQNSD